MAYSWKTQTNPDVNSEVSAEISSVVINNTNYLIQQLKNNTDKAEAQGKSSSDYDDLNYLAITTIQNDILNSVDPFTTLQGTLDIIDDIKYCSLAYSPHDSSENSANQSTECSNCSSNLTTQNSEVNASHNSSVRQN